MTAVPDRPAVGRPGPGQAGRRAILEAAARAFARRGYLATTIDAIADDLGSTKGRIYHYYRSKPEVFLAVVVAGMHDLIDEMEPLSRGGRPSERLHAMARRHAELMMVQHSAQRVSVQAVEMRTVPELAAHRDLLATSLELRRRYEQLFVDVVEEGVAAGELEADDTRLAVRSVLGALNWIPIWWDPDRPEGATEVSRVAERLARFVVRGLRP